MADNRTKAQIVADAVQLDQRRQQQIKRQIDSINRLMGHELDGKVDPGMPRYEHELMHLNEQLALKDIRVEMLEGVLRRIRQSCTDRLAAGIAGSTHREPFETVLNMMEEVMPNERPAHVATGHDTSSVAVTDQSFEYIVEPPDDRP